MFESGTTANLKHVKILTEADLRVRNGSPRLEKVVVLDGVFITPLAKEYLQDHDIELIVADSARAYAAGEKPENMTHLRGMELVHKSHERIYLRGQLDLLQAEIIVTQTTAMAQSKTKAIALLDELLQFVRHLLGVEVSGKAVEKDQLFGIALDRFRSLSHEQFAAHSLESLTPHAAQGRLAAELNCLRARVRVCELAAIAAFPADERPDLIRAMNRLSSAAFMLYYWVISGLPEEEWHD